MSDAKDTTTNGSASGSSMKHDVMQQVEFYLSDSNLPFDKFLFSLWSDSFHQPAAVVLATPVPDADANPATLKPHSQVKHDRFHLGWVPLATLCSFKRMRDYLEQPPKGLGGIDNVGEALEPSTEVQARKFGDEGQEGAGWYVRKAHELGKSGDLLERSVYAKGFPVTDAKDDSAEAKQAVKDAELDLQKRIEAWARSLDIGRVLSVRMRRHDKEIAGGKSLKGQGKFKGSVFIEFAGSDSVTKFLALEPKPTFEGADLEVMSKSEYVEVKREKYAPGSKVETNGGDKAGKGKNIRGFNAWAQHLIDDKGFPSVVAADAKKDGSDSRKRKADDGDDEREIMFDGVRFKAKRTGRGEDANIELVDEAQIGTKDGEWPLGRLLKFSASGDKAGQMNFLDLKNKIASIAKPGFIGLASPKEDRPVAGLPAAGEDQPKPKATAPPTVVSASDAAAAASSKGGASDAKDGTASFKEVVSDEALEKIKSEFGTFEGQTLTWSRASADEERAHNMSRARWHAREAFSGERGGRGGRGGGRGGRGGRGGARGGRGGNKRQRRD